jgi:hypothetical protein
VEKVASTWPAAHFRPRVAVLKGLFFSSYKTVQYHHTIINWFGVLTESMASTWVAVKAARAVKSSIPVNCPWGSTRSCRVAPVHFQSPIGSLVSSLHVRVPLTGPRGPPAEGPVCSAVEAAIPPVNRRGVARYSCEGPHPLLAAICGLVLSLPTCTCWAQYCCCRR